MKTGDNFRWELRGAGFTGWVVALLSGAIGVGSGFGQQGADRRVLPVHWHPHPIVPITRPFGPPRPESRPVEVTGVGAAVTVVDQLATTQMDIALHNPNGRQVESEIVIPVPDGSVLRGFSFEGTNLEATAKILRKDEARKIYEAIVAQTRDPALLEFVGTGMLQSSVFPVPPGGSQKVRVIYERLLAVDGVRMDFLLPRSEALEYRVPWDITIDVRSAAPIASLYSPSHELKINRISDKHVKASVLQTTQPGAFQFSCLRQKSDDVTASLIAYPDPKVGGGYFMLLVAPPALGGDAAKHEALKREVTVVIDRSGSMAGEKLEQVRAAALQVLEGMAEGEAFNIIVYNESVEMFSRQPLVKTAERMKEARRYLNGLRVSGGTKVPSDSTRLVRWHLPVYVTPSPPQRYTHRGGARNLMTSKVGNK